MKKTSLWTSLAMTALAVQMSGRILTPNGDGIHDSVAFTLASPEIGIRAPKSTMFGDGAWRN